MRFICFYLFLISSLSFSTASALTIAIDAGHGGNDQGTSFEDLKESKLTLDIAKSLIAVHTNKPDIHFVLIRNTNKYLSLQERIDQAKALKADLFLSLHINSAPLSTIEGIEIYFSEAKYNSSSETTLSHPIVNSILNSLEQTAQWKNSLLFAKNLKIQILKSPALNSKTIIKKTPFYVLENNAMPAVLIELGFLSNETDRLKLIDENYRKILIDRIYAAILKTTETLQDKGLPIEPTSLQTH